MTGAHKPRNTGREGRGVLPKVLAFGLVIVAFIPAIVVIIIAAVVPSDEFEVFRPHRYYNIKMCWAMWSE